MAVVIDRREFQASDLSTGDEVISPYWVAANPNEEVSVLQIAAYTGPRDYQLGYFEQVAGATDSSQLTLNGVITRSPTDGQTLLPTGLINGIDSEAIAQNTFDPNGPFSFYIEWLASGNTDFGDPIFQPTDRGASGNSVLPGGDILIRTFPLIAPDGNAIPDTFLLFQDYASINFDWNDNVYIVSNIRPA